MCTPCKAILCYPGIGTSLKGPLAEEADIPQKPLPEEATLSAGKAVEVQPCTSNVQEESRYPQEEPAQAGSSYSSHTDLDDSCYPESGRQTRSQTGSLPVPTKMTMAEEMNSKTHI